MPDQATVWHLYVLRCADRSLYTGISTDVERRIREHQDARKGAKYLRGRGPLKLEYSSPMGSRSRATQVERRVKKLSRKDKERLILGILDVDDL